MSAYSVILTVVIAVVRRTLTWFRCRGKKQFLHPGCDLHVGRGTRLWAPSRLYIGNHVYIGKDVSIACNAQIGDYCLIADRVALVGRRDHDFRAIGFPVRFSPWIGSNRFPVPDRDEEVVMEEDVWVGFGAIVLTGVHIGRGSVIASGSVVVHDVPSYSVVGGFPARVIGQRFNSEEEITQHEFSLANGEFCWSERGYDKALIAPCILDETKSI